MIAAQGDYFLGRQHFVECPSHLRGQGKPESLKGELLHGDVLFGNGNLEGALARKFKELAEFEISMELAEPSAWIGNVLYTGRDAQLRVREHARRARAAFRARDSRLEGAQFRIIAERVSRQAFQRIGSRHNARQQDHDR